MIENIKVFGKFLDQPKLINKLNSRMPQILGVMGGAYFTKIAYDSFTKNKNADTMQKKSRQKKELSKNFIVLSGSIASALDAPRIAAKITKRVPFDSFADGKNDLDMLITDFLEKNPCSIECRNILNKAKEKILSFKDVKTLIKNFKTKEQKELFEQLIPNPKNIKAKDIFQEIGYLSVYGAVPVLGGITGGITADVLHRENLKKTVPDKINEGIYQYLANIFMCNIGAGAALAVLEKKNITSKSARAAGMTAGIILTGIVGGSKIANFITKYVVSPFTNNKNKQIKERTPEALDIGLHSDDIATVSLLSGLKWIEPALPVLYSVSGYRAGTGYRG